MTAARRTVARRRRQPSAPAGPWWLTAATTAATKFGVPAVLLAVVLYFMFTKFDAHMVQTAELIQHLNEEADRGWYMLGAVQQTCLNTAKTDADRLACVTVTRRPQ